MSGRVYFRIKLRSPFPKRVLNDTDRHDSHQFPTVKVLACLRTVHRCRVDLKMCAAHIVLSEVRGARRIVFDLEQAEVGRIFGEVGGRYRWNMLAAE
jgi:hypothetical protein